MHRIDLLQTLRRDVRIVVAGLLLGLAVAAALSATAERTYASSTQLFVGTGGSTASADAYEGNLFSQQRTASYAEVLTSQELAQRVVAATGLPLTAREVAGKVAATPLPETVVLDVVVTDTSAERAQLIATALAQQFIQRVSELEAPANATSPVVSITVLQPADLDPTPVSPDTAGNLWRGAAVGLVLGIAVVLVRSRLDRTVREVDDVEQATGAPVIGRVFADRELARKPLTAGAGGQSPNAEAFRALRVNLRHLGSESGPRVVVVAGALPGEGATTVASELAVSLARAGGRVVLVDADLRRPQVRRRLQLPDGPGLTELLTGAAQLSDVVQQWGDGPGLAVLGAGALPADPEALLGSPAMAALLRDLRESRDVVVLDAPPLLPVVDAAVLSAQADACLLVARYGRTRRGHLAEAAAAVARVRVPALGVVLTRLPHRARVATTGSMSYAADRQRRRAVPAGPVPPAPPHQP
ncbi:polysaccharide biosynthesis tyrosine autokinase [Modestobacter sp. SSW1-42]|uniref:polysaccharide biosynthesis tyrosine autokinase n=1 Tax=Modestobacter sp. SSW1-42 TaxID=596372 RepID=UPI003986D15B